MKYYSAEKNNDIMKFAGKWMELENIILSEVTQFQKEKIRPVNTLSSQSLSPMTDGRRCRDPQPNTRQSSRSPVNEREEGFYEQVHEDHDRETCRDDKTKLMETHESWINGCGAYMELD
ncbi:hypothetical protein STEG23_012582 [Scotinomys teguina]